MALGELSAHKFPLSSTFHFRYFGTIAKFLFFVSISANCEANDATYKQQQKSYLVNN